VAKSTRRLGLLVLFAVLAGGVWMVVSAFAAPAPPAPTITGTHPANPTTSTSASFSYSDTQGGVTYTCNIDGGSALTCPTSGNAGPFTVSANASHTFSISAVSGGKTSSAATFTWYVDQAAPTVSVSFPAASGSYNAAGWAAGCSGGAGICGTASDPSGVASVSVSVLQQSSGKYWNGSSFTPTSETWLTPTGTTSWRYPLSLPADGSYTVHVRSADSLGNNNNSSPSSVGFTIDTQPPAQPSITSGPPSLTNNATATFNFSAISGGGTYLCSLDGGSYAACSNPASFTVADGSHNLRVEAKDAAGNVSPPSSAWSWTSDTTPPPKPGITGPNNKSSSLTATFQFTDGESPVTYKCSMDGGAFNPCPNPATFYSLTPGTHELDAEAVDQAGNVGPFNGWKWTINGNEGAGLNFSITSAASGALTPGGPVVYLNLTLTNPNSYTLYINSLTVTLSSVSPVGCSTSNFSAIAPFSGVYPIVLPPGPHSYSLQGTGPYQLGYTQAQLPHLSMLDLNGKQDICEHATLNLTYGGSATS